MPNLLSKIVENVRLEDRSLMSMKKNSKTIVLGLGGSVIVPNEIQINFLKKFRKFILKFLKQGFKFIIVTGGGATARNYMKAISKITKTSDDDKDWLGISATLINAHLLRACFGKWAYPEILDNPLKRCDLLGRSHLIIASGWKPGWSTDYVVVLFAKRFKVKKVIFISNIDYIYDKNPALNKNAKPIKEISWQKYQKLIKSKWRPGMKVPIDPVATRLALKLKMTAILASGTDLKNLENIIKGKKFKGTIVYP